VRVWSCAHPDRLLDPELKGRLLRLAFAAVNLAEKQFTRRLVHGTEQIVCTECNAVQVPAGTAALMGMDTNIHAGWCETGNVLRLYRQIAKPSPAIDLDPNRLDPNPLRKELKAEIACEPRGGDAIPPREPEPRETEPRRVRAGRGIDALLAPEGGVQ
jgi:hypothetical protein